MFVEFTGKKLVGSRFAWLPPILNRVKLSLDIEVEYNLFIEISDMRYDMGKGI